MRIGTIEIELTGIGPQMSNCANETTVNELNELDHWNRIGQKKQTENVSLDTNSEGLAIFFVKKNGKGTIFFFDTIKKIQFQSFESINLPK